MAETMIINGHERRATKPRFSMRLSLMTGFITFMVGAFFSMILLIVFLPLGILTALITLAMPFVMGCMIRTAPCPHCDGQARIVVSTVRCPDCRTPLAIRNGRVVDLIH